MLSSGNVSKYSWKRLPLEKYHIYIKQIYKTQIKINTVCWILNLTYIVKTWTDIMSQYQKLPINVPWQYGSCYGFLTWYNEVQEY